MALTISPSDAQKVVIGQPLCFEGSGIVSLPQSDIAPLDIATSGTNWTYNPTTQVFKKVSGTNPSFSDALAITTSTINALQPFYIRMANTSFVTPGGANNNSHCIIGVQTSDDVLYSVGVMKYCNSNNSTCGAVGAPGQNWVMTVQSSAAGIIYTRGVNFNEVFYIRSNGTSLIFEHIEGGVYITDVMIPLPTTDNWRLVVAGGYVGNEISEVAFWKGSYQGAVPITWSITGTHAGDAALTGTDTNKCFSTPTAGTYHVCIDSEFDDELCVEVEADDLYFNPVTMDCGQCAFTGDTVHFESNGGLTGTLTVVDADENPVGTVLDALTWQAPGNPVDVTATYTLGEASVDCEVQVVDRIKVYNVTDFTIAGLAPGDTYQITTNYPYPQMEWTNLDCQNIVSKEGLISIPGRLNDDCFGAMDCQVRGYLVDVEGFTCDNLTSGDGQQYVDIRIVVDPVFPTPEFGGPSPVKWKPETPEYKVLINEFEGGCDETYLRNRVAVRKWTIRYAGLRYDVDNPCAPAPCCDDTQGYVDGYDPQYQIAKRLDDFWNVVGGTSGYFTLKDFRDGTLWRRVRFDSQMGRDHINWRTIQSRDLSLVWHPCCAVEPEGGVCPHNTRGEDQIPPSVPPNPAALAYGFDTIWVSWDSSADNIGVKSYALEVNGGGLVNEIINVGLTNAYQVKHLTESTEYTFRLQAFDFAHNPSDWTDEFTATTYAEADTLPETPYNLYEVSHTKYTITAGWDSSMGIGDGSYEIRCGAAIVGTPAVAGGLHKTYTFDKPVADFGGTGGIVITKYTVQVRSVDTAGKKSAWCAPVDMGTDIIDN